MLNYSNHTSGQLTLFSAIFVLGYGLKNNFDVREGFKKKHKLRTVSQVRLPPPAPELRTSLSEILLTVFFKFVELGLTDQFSSILVSKHLRRLGHSIWGVGPPPPLLGQCPKFVTLFF